MLGELLLVMKFKIEKQEDNWWSETMNRLKSGQKYPECVIHNGYKPFPYQIID